MQSKLTLRLDSALIEKARSWSESRHVSLSRAVSDFFAQLPDDSRPGLDNLSPWTRRLVGAAASPEPTPTDEELQKTYREHLEAKHG